MDGHDGIYRSLFEDSRDAMYMTTREGLFVEANQAMLDLFGFSREELLGMSAKIIYAEPLDRESFRRAIEERGFVRDYEIHFRRKSGLVMDCLLTAACWRTPDGAIAGYQGIIRDITGQKRSAEALMQSQQELLSQHRELQAAYVDLKASQAKILQQEKMACIGQLAAGVAHEINNPIGFVSSNLTTLEKYADRLIEFITLLSRTMDASPGSAGAEEVAEGRRALKIDYVMDDARHLIGESIEGVARVRKIVQDLKSFSRVDEAEYKYADINDCIESTVNIAWNELKYKVDLRKQYGKLPLTKCYPQQLNQVFMNLLVNAVQAIEDQGTIAITTWCEDGSICAAVTDTGSGILPEHLERIFEPFFTTKEVGKGTGLGLSITYDIVKKHEGEITVQSLPGKGTTFSVRIPVKNDDGMGD
jgi:two-component system NtrC family sensor kinase